MVFPERRWKYRTSGSHMSRRFVQGQQAEIPAPAGPGSAGGGQREKGAAAAIFQGRQELRVHRPGACAGDQLLGGEVVDLLLLPGGVRIEDHQGPGAEQGYPLAECQIGYFYLERLGVEKDPERAFYWTRRAAEHGGQGEGDGRVGLEEDRQQGHGEDIEQQKTGHHSQTQGGGDAAQPCEELDRCNELIAKYWETKEYDKLFAGYLPLAELE